MTIFCSPCIPCFPYAFRFRPKRVSSCFPGFSMRFNVNDKPSPCSTCIPHVFSSLPKQLPHASPAFPCFSIFTTSCPHALLAFPCSENAIQEISHASHAFPFLFPDIRSMGSMGIMGKPWKNHGPHPFPHAICTRVGLVSRKKRAKTVW